MVPGNFFCLFPLTFSCCQGSESGERRQNVVPFWFFNQVLPGSIKYKVNFLFQGPWLKGGFVDQLQVVRFLPSCDPSYGALALTPAGFTLLLNTLAFIGHTRFLDNTAWSAEALRE